MATGVIYRVDCTDRNSPKITCARKYDAKCVIYKGKPLDYIDVSPGNDVELVIIKLDSVLEALNDQISDMYDGLEVEKDILYDRLNTLEATLESIKLQVTSLDENYTLLNGKLDDLNSNFCERVQNCIS